MTTSRTTPINASRTRVLAAYRQRREQGDTPFRAMDGLRRALFQAAFPYDEPELFGPAEKRQMAEDAWDHFYTSRYLKIIEENIMNPNIDQHWMGL